MFSSEYIELQALQGLYAAAKGSLRSELGIRCLETKDTFALQAKRLPRSAIVINRVIGLGLNSEPGQDEFNALINFYEDNAIERYFVHLHPDAKPAVLTQWLKERALIEARAWQKFELSKSDFSESNTALTVRLVNEQERADAAQIICDAFDLGDLSVPWLTELSLQEHWHVFVAIIDDTVAGTGSVYIQNNLAWLDFGATAPEFRCKGCQSALLNARLAYAFSQGCDKALTCTGVDVEGDPQHSYKNILKAGFKPTYVRRNFANC